MCTCAALWYYCESNKELFITPFLGKFTAATAGHRNHSLTNIHLFFSNASLGHESYKDV